MSPAPKTSEKGHPAGKRETWILNGKLITQNEKREAIPGHLRIVGNRIAEIRRNAPRRPSRSAHLIDVKGACVLPGFVQSHVHLCQTLFRK